MPGNVADVEANVATGSSPDAGRQPTGQPSNPGTRPGDGPGDHAPAGDGGSGDGTPGGGLAPLPYDGVGSVAVGTVLWLIALILMIVFNGPLRDGGHLWWLATAACGFALGLVGLVIVVRRRNRIRRGEPSTGN